MSYNSSMQYTIGTALNRAREHDHCVEVLIEGQWLTGLVVASDGIGIVLEGEDAEHSVIRLERVSAVRVRASSPFFRKIEGATRPTVRAQRGPDGAFPMPAPPSP